MKLSKAIRQGQGRQIRGAFVVKGDDGKVTGTCALGGALLAVVTFEELEALSVSDEQMDAYFSRIWPNLPYGRSMMCPECLRFIAPDSQAPYGLIGIIWHLNDSHNWTRDQIADFVLAEEAKIEDALLVEAGV